MRNIHSTMARSLLGLVVISGIAVSAQAAGFGFKSLHSFKQSDGQMPVDTLVQGPDGLLYGTTYAGGRFGQGVIYKATLEGAVTVVHDFGGTAIDGRAPVDGLALANDGNFYGATQVGGAHGLGALYRLTPEGVVTVLHSFDDNGPTGAPIQASDGNLYGTGTGGTNGCGVVYRMTLAGGFTILRSFKADFVDGCVPMARLVQANDGNLYGTTQLGGAADLGTVFRATLAGSIKTIHSFDGSSGGAQPFSPVVQAGDGKLYGTTAEGGDQGNGTVFKVTLSGKFTVLHSFDGIDGRMPYYGGLLRTPDGNFHGTTSRGGANGVGTVFRISPKGSVRVLHLSTMFWQFSLGG